ncbi:hypothetical protein D3C78_1424170 [compost metagenome]
MQIDHALLLHVLLELDCQALDVGDPSAQRRHGQFDQLQHPLEQQNARDVIQGMIEEVRVRLIHHQLGVQ